MFRKIFSRAREMMKMMTLKMMKSRLRYWKHMDREMYVLRWLPTFLHLIVCRHQWTNGYMFRTDISIFYLRWRASQRPPSVHYAKKPWLSSVVIVLEATTSVFHAAFKHTSGPHSIGYSTGLVLTFHQYLCIRWGLSYVLNMMANHVLLQWM
jgi:hypothetical protein